MSQDVTIFVNGAQLAKLQNLIRSAFPDRFQQYEDGSFSLTSREGGTGYPDPNFNVYPPGKCFFYDEGEGPEGHEAELAQELDQRFQLRAIYTDIRECSTVLQVADDPDVWVHFASFGVVRADNLADVLRDNPNWDWRTVSPPPGLRVVFE